MGLVSRPVRPDVLNPRLEQSEAQDPQVWIWGIIRISNMYPSRQRSKAGPERQESKRPYLIQNLIHLHRELELGKENTAQSHLKLPMPPAPTGRRDDITAGLDGLHRCSCVESWGLFVENCPSRHNVYRALLTTHSPYSYHREPTGRCEVPSILGLPGVGDHLSFSHNSPQLLPKQKAWLCKTTVQSRRRSERVLAQPIIRAQLVTETVLER